ncbi:MAG: hypothetical protein HY648_13585 [Acidobacteria bacterium]|nr:hypothetical protein [Acidobacteriota bacterium]
MRQNERPRTPSGLGRRLWESPLPTLGWEISQFGVGAAQWQSGASEFGGMSWKPIPPGAVEASPVRENFRQPEEVEKALAAALAPLGISEGEKPSRPRDVALVIPDQAARLFVLPFESFPEKPEEALALVKFRLKKSVPFDIDSSSISFFAQPADGQWEVTAVATSRTVVRQYEELAERFGLRPRWVSLSSLASLELIQDGVSKGRRESEGVLVAKSSPPWLTVVVLQGESIRLFRTVPISATAENSIVTAEVLEAIYPSAAYFQDTFQSPLGPAYLCGLGESSTAVAESLERELGVRARPLLGGEGQAEGGLDPNQREWHFAALYGMAQGQMQR